MTMLVAVVVALVIGWVMCWITQASNRRTKDEALELHADYVRRTLQTAEAQASLALRLDSVLNQQGRVIVGLEELVKTTDALDRSVGNILSAMVNSGMIRSTGQLREIQTGETPVTRGNIARAIEGAGDVLIPPAGEEELR